VVEGEGMWGGGGGGRNCILRRRTENVLIRKQSLGSQVCLSHSLSS